MNEKQIKIPSDIKKQLLPDEYVIYKLKPSWKIFIDPVAILLLTLVVFYFCKDGKSDTELFFCILCAVGLGIFVSNFVILLNEYFKSLFLTNRRVIANNFSKEINLEEIKKVTMQKIGEGYSEDLYYMEKRLLFLRLFVLFTSFYNITFYCKDRRKSATAIMANIDKKDYEKFKKLLTKECKKLGNNIS